MFLINSDDQRLTKFTFEQSKNDLFGCNKIYKFGNVNFLYNLTW